MAKAMQMKMKLMASLALVMAAGLTSAHTHTDPAAPKGKIVNVDNYDFEKEKVDSGSGIPSDRNLNLIENTYTFTSSGAGYCRDGLGNAFDAMVYFGNSVVATADACREKCVACPGQGQIENSDGDSVELRGYTFIPHASGSVCYCYVEDGATFYASACLSQGYDCGTVPDTVPTVILP
eukprot:scaffold20270_cov125-Skeletonema_marinoi.AAC.5